MAGRFGESPWSSYEDSRDLFSIPYDIDILQEVFSVKGDHESDLLFKNDVHMVEGEVLSRQEEDWIFSRARGYV